MNAKPTEEEQEIRDSDRDALHVLPLSILPIETPALNRARLIKNVRLESVVELFEDADSGSGQIEIESLPGEFHWSMKKVHPDLALLRKLAIIPSYDAYSLRITLREHGIAVNSFDALKLSEEKNRELTEYMTKFTRPLILQIYGDQELGINTVEDVIKLFRQPDVKKALEKLKMMASKLQIGLEDVPKFLEDYGDIFMSLSYYRQCLDVIEPIITEFLHSMNEMRGNWQLKQDKNLMKTCDMLENTFNNLMVNITGRFETFDRSTGTMWDNITAERFRRVESLIESYHTTIGGVLCALTVKMEAWNRLFPSPDSGGPMRRGEFMMSEMRQGIEKIKRVEDSAPALRELND